MQFRNAVVEYFNALHGRLSQSNRLAHSYEGPDPAEGAQIQTKRRQINLMMNEATWMIRACGVSATMYYSPPRAVGGLAGEIDLIANLFQFPDLGLDPQILLDQIDQAIGILERDQRGAWLRTFNPFFWLGRVFDWIAELPFLLLGRLGFNQDRIEASFVGRFVKGVLYLVTVIATVIPALQSLGYLDAVKLFFQQIWSRLH